MSYSGGSFNVLSFSLLILYIIKCEILFFCHKGEQFKCSLPLEDFLFGVEIFCNICSSLPLYLTLFAFLFVGFRSDIICNISLDGFFLNLTKCVGFLLFQMRVFPRPDSNNFLCFFLIRASFHSDHKFSIRIMGQNYINYLLL